MRNVKKTLMVTIALMIALITLINIPKLFISKQVEELPEIKLKELGKNKTFAIMVQNGEGTNYENYTGGNTWPIEEYKFSKAECIDGNGKLVENAISYNQENNKVSLTTNSTIYCTLYFDKRLQLNLKTLCEKYNNLNECIKMEKYNIRDVVDLSPDTQGGMYRYQAAPSDASAAAQMGNWICFGTKDKNECTSEEGIDKYMYRIIGITEEGQLYLLKETFLKEETNIRFLWHSLKYLTDCLGDKCEWPNVDLYKRLNGKSNGTSAGSSGNTNIFLGTVEHPSEYEYLTEGTTWYNLIADHDWMYGDTNETNGSKIYNGNEMYEIETGNTATKRYWPDEGIQTTCSINSPCTEKNYEWKSIPDAKISLMYIHDVDYAYYDGSNENTRGVPQNYTNVKNSWINLQKDGYNSSLDYEWLSTRFGAHGDTGDVVSARRVVSTGDMHNANNLNSAHGVRPVFYLNSNVKITSGDGNKENPFILS